MMITLIISSSYGIPLAQTKAYINDDSIVNDNNSTNNNKKSINDICKKVSAIGNLMNNNDDSIVEISIGNDIILARSLNLLKTKSDCTIAATNTNTTTTTIGNSNSNGNSNDNSNNNNNNDNNNNNNNRSSSSSNDYNNNNNSNNNENNTNENGLIYIIFYFQYNINSNTNIIPRLKLYSLYIGYIVILILNDDIKKYYDKIKKEIDDRNSSSTFQSTVNNHHDDDIIDIDNDIFTNLEDHFLCKILYVLLNDQQNDDNNNNNNDNNNEKTSYDSNTKNIINWFTPMCRSIPEVAAVECSYIYSIEPIATEKRRLTHSIPNIKVQLEYFQNLSTNHNNEVSRLSESCEAAMISFYCYCLSCYEDWKDGTVINFIDSDINKHYLLKDTVDFGLLVAIILTDTNAKLIVALKVPKKILNSKTNNLKYSDYILLSPLESLPLQLFQCWKECIFRIKKAFMSKESLYYIARTLNNNSIETYDTILKNSTSITDYYKLIPAPPVHSEKSQSRPLSRGRKIKEK